jgi:hypothetical protein
MTESVEIRAHIVDVFRRDLIGPGEQDADLANERLNESPSRWYLTGFSRARGRSARPRWRRTRDQSVNAGRDGNRG